MGTNFPKNIWSQLKNLTQAELLSALARDGWRPDPASKSKMIALVKDSQKLTLSYHGENYAPRTLKSTIAKAGWAEDDLRRLKLVK